MFDDVVSKTMDAIHFSQFHSLSKRMVTFEINSPAVSELRTGRAGAPRSFMPLEPKTEPSQSI